MTSSANVLRFWIAEWKICRKYLKCCSIDGVLRYSWIKKSFHISLLCKSSSKEKRSLKWCLLFTQRSLSAICCRMNHNTFYAHAKIFGNQVQIISSYVKPVKVSIIIVVNVRSNRVNLLPDVLICLISWVQNIDSPQFSVCLGRCNHESINHTFVPMFHEAWEFCHDFFL